MAAIASGQEKHDPVVIRIVQPYASKPAGFEQHERDDGPQCTEQSTGTLEDSS